MVNRKGKTPTGARQTKWRDTKVAGGWKSESFLLSPAAQAELKRLTTAYGSKTQAIEHLLAASAKQAEG